MKYREDMSPQPKSHIKTLMRIGYNLNSAIADIIDNSITAKASKISITCPSESDEPFVSFVDNGEGMSPSELIQNMRIGCKDPNVKRESGDLGRFGSGMKTASFSHARKLTVISKKKGNKIAAACWDIYEI
jgi:HSP90 family molecular chaperone